MIIELRAKLLTEQGSHKKLLIPPHTTKLCPVVFDSKFYQDRGFEAYIAPELAKRSLLFIQIGPLDYTVAGILIHNGGWETQWIEHEELVVNIYEFRT
jgi:hypothetical protein